MPNLRWIEDQAKAERSRKAATHVFWSAVGKCGHTLSGSERVYCDSCVRQAIKRFSDLLWLGSTGYSSMRGYRWRLHAS